MNSKRSFTTSTLWKPKRPSKPPNYIEINKTFQKPVRSKTAIIPPEWIHCMIKHLNVQRKDDLLSFEELHSFMQKSRAHHNLSTSRLREMFDYADKDGDGLLDYYDLQFAFQRNNRDFEDWVRVLKVLRLKNPDMKYVVILTERDYLPKIEITTKFDEEESIPCEKYSKTRKLDLTRLKIPSFSTACCTARRPPLTSRVRRRWYTHRGTTSKSVTQSPEFKYYWNLVNSISPTEEDFPDKVIELVTQKVEKKPKKPKTFRNFFSVREFDDIQSLKLKAIRTQFLPKEPYGEVSTTVYYRDPPPKNKPPFRLQFTKLKTIDDMKRELATERLRTRYYEDRMIKS